MRNKFLDLQSGTVVNAKELLTIAGAKDEVWKAADGLYSLLSDIAVDQENQAQNLLMETAIIRGHLKKYDQAEDKLDGTEQQHTEQQQQGDVATLEELVDIEGVSVAAEWNANWHLQNCKWKMGLSEEEAQQKAKFCATVAMMFNNFASSFTQLSGMQWRPQQGWAYSGEGWTVAVGKGGNLGVFIDTVEADYNRVIEALLE